MLHLLWDPRHPWVVCSKALTYLWWDRVLSVFNSCIVGEKGSATPSWRKRRARWHLVLSFHRDGVSFAPVAGFSRWEFFGFAADWKVYPRFITALSTAGNHSSDSASVEKATKDPFSTSWWNTTNAEYVGAPVKRQCLWSRSLFQGFASWFVQGWELPFPPCHCSDSAHSPGSGSKDINLLSSKRLKNDKMLFTWAGSITCCLSEEIFSKGAFLSRQEIPARSAMKNTRQDSPPPSQSSHLAIIFCETCIWKQNVSFPEPWKSRQKAKGIAQSKCMQGAVHRVCFKPPLQELLLALHWKFRNAGVKPGCVPSRRLERCWRTSLNVQLKQMESLLWFGFSHVPRSSSSRAECTVNICTSGFLSAAESFLGRGQETCLCRIKIWSQDFHRGFRASESLFVF